jgi:peptide-methionine (R)-S-oxide reductase
MLEHSETNYFPNTNPPTTEQYRILRQKGTEKPFANRYDKHYSNHGTYNCAACDKPLYRADQKFKSSCGWPAYYDSIPGAVARLRDPRFPDSEASEIVCANCGGHLGHVFAGEGFPTPTNQRHCVNSVSIRFEEGGWGD